MDFHHMLNYREVEDQKPVHYVKTIRTVREIALFLADTSDMGFGIAVFDVKMPEGTDAA